MNPYEMLQQLAAQIYNEPRHDFPSKEWPLIGNQHEIDQALKDPAQHDEVQAALDGGWLIKSKPIRGTR